MVQPYRYPHFKKNEIEKIVKQLLVVGVIHPCNSTYVATVLLVKKHDRSWRMCIDYRVLNKIMVKDKFSIPMIDELLDELTKAQHFMKLDLRSSYY